jgi:transposase
VIGSTRSVRVFAYTVATDMRKGMDGLYGLVTSLLAKDPLSGDLFLFVSRDRKRAKVLLWDGTGLCLYAKRLERGQFAKLWAGEEESTLELTMSEMSLFLEGSRLVGKVAVSPQKLCIKCLTDHGMLARIEHAEAGEHQGSRHTPAGSHPPREDGHQSPERKRPTSS